ncbi:S-layer homology domain-containing protein [Desulforudis sp. DRI-14]|uniref:S-layer homology domain-containing protein n=1 Tax=Desulforudis sp. DRI-14 TaxID=3459793 RepID=UPI004041BEE9
MRKKAISWMLTAAMMVSLFVSVPITAYADSNIVLISGEIQGNITWTADNQYVMDGDTYVKPGSTLTINPGVIVKIKPGVRFLVDGTLNASGTTGNEIYFTDFRDDTVGGDTNGDGDASSPAAGGWTYMLLGYNSSATANLSHCVVRYGGGGWGGWGNDSLIAINGGSNVNIDNCELAHSLLRGIRIENATGTVSISNSTLHDNVDNGLFTKNSTPTITNNAFSGNGQYGLYVQGSALPSNISGNTFSDNTKGSIGLGATAAGTSIASNNSGVEGIWVLDGEISNNTLWDTPFPYVLTGDTYVKPGVTLTINPGVVVKIKPGVRFLVDGTLNASGTTGNEIYFTDFRDDTVGGDTNGDGSDSSPAPGGWTYILLGYNGSATATLSHCVVRYGGGSWGGWGNDSLIAINGGSNVNIDNCELAHSLLRGIRIESVTGTVSISNSAVYDNAQYGLYINNSTGNVTINGCQIYNSLSGQININNSPNVTITATPAEMLNASVAPGTVAGSTKVTATVGSGNHLVVQISSSTISNVDLHSIAPTGVGIIDPYTEGADISGVDPITNRYLAVYETNANNKIVKFKLIPLAGSDIYTAPVLQNAMTNADGSKIILSFNKAMADPTGKHEQFSVVSGGSGNAVAAATLGTDTKTIELTLTTPIVYGQAVTVDYTPGTIAAADGGMLTAFANQEVTNNVAANVAKIGSIGYPTLAGALAAANDTDTIVLISDINYSNGITADAKNVDIDLNGFNLTVSGVAGHALEAKNNGVLNILDEDGSGVVTVNSSGEYKHCVNAVSGGKVNIKGSLTASLPAGAGSYQNIIGAYADGLGSTINLTGSAFGHMAGIYAQGGAVITVSGNVDGSYYGAFSAYSGSVNVKGNVSGSRALVSEYGGIATVEGDITGSDHAISANAIAGWDPPTITVTGNVTGTGGVAVSVSNDADIQITGDVTGYIAASGSPPVSPDVTINGDITVNTGFGVSVFYGGTVTINGSILGASPYLKLDNLDISKNDYEIFGDYLVYSNTTVSPTAPPYAEDNTVRVKIPQGGYTVTIGTLSGGMITASPTSATPGTNINLTITPDTGKQLKAGTLKYNDGNNHSITGTSFVMPPDNVTVTAEFENTLINQAPVITSNWGYNTVYFGENYPYTITVSDAENTSGTKIYSSLDGAEFSVVWTYPGAPDTQNMTLSPLKGGLASGSHTLRYYAQDLGGVVSNMLTLTFTVTDKPVSPPINGSSGGSGGSTSADTGAKTTVTTSDGQVSVTGILTQTNGGTQVVIKNDDFNKVNNADKPAAVDAHLAAVVFDKKAMDTIGTSAGSGDVVLMVRQVPATELSVAQKALVGSRPVYDFTVTGAGKTISNFNGGHATVNIPYVLGMNEHPHAIVIWYLSDSGRLVRMRGHYDNATKSVTFKTSHFSNFVIGYNPISFQDVSAGAWYESAVTFLAARDITTGTGDGNFSPDASLTRGQFIVMLMRAYGIEPDANPVDNFADAGNTYYTNFIATAKRLDIANGIGNNLFAPDREITRQEMFTLLYNALTAIGELPEGRADKKLSDFSDASQIASWAKDAMTLLVETGTISGSDDKLSPTDGTTRAEMAQVLCNLFTK